MFGPISIEGGGGESRRQFFSLYVGRKREQAHKGKAIRMKWKKKKKRRRGNSPHIRAPLTRGKRLRGNGGSAFFVGGGGSSS